MGVVLKDLEQVVLQTEAVTEYGVLGVRFVAVKEVPEAPEIPNQIGVSLQSGGRVRKEDYLGNPHRQICHETIYAFIYKEKTEFTKQGLISQSLLDKRLASHNQAITVTGFNRPLYEYLRRKQTKRRKRSGRKVHRLHIPDRVSIHLRPPDFCKFFQLKNGFPVRTI